MVVMTLIYSIFAELCVFEGSAKAGMGKWRPAGPRGHLMRPATCVTKENFNLKKEKNFLIHMAADKSNDLQNYKYFMNIYS